jgi:murein L,D-transpeptidase YcbB/YkuD
VTKRSSAPSPRAPRPARFFRGTLAALALGVMLGSPALAEVPSFTRAVAEAASTDESMAAFYRERGYAPLWTGPDAATRREAFLTALDGAAAQGLPPARYDRDALVAAFRSAVTEGDRGRLEVAMSRAFATFAGDLKAGVIDPRKLDKTIVREIDRPQAGAVLAAFAAAEPWGFFHGLAPRTPEYARLMKEKLRLEGVIAAGGWGPGVPGQMKPGATGAGVVALRDRLEALGYLGHSVTGSYDRTLVRAVQRFQSDNGITPDGVVGASTLAALNTAPETRLQSVVVALERLRWMGDTPRGARHIWVNQPDFTAKIVDDGAVTFQTRAVIGKNVPEQRTPEFSDEMEYMVVNPSWGVPRSIIVKEYLPLLQKNPNAVSHIQVVDSRGRVVPRGAVNFAAYSASSFPFSMRQPPSDGNALGKVKFMFPNQYNIYLHDTPSKNLFANEVRAYSHGCIRLGDPFDFAYALLARQSADPQASFQADLATGRETQVSLQEKVPVHLVYFTAWPTAKGAIGYRNDIYGRDAAIFRAMSEAGVALPQVQG